ncbi:MAG: hypothetical protein WC070_04910 [Candidatus Magasanikbacteria bacterium]
MVKNTKNSIINILADFKKNVTVLKAKRTKIVKDFQKKIKDVEIKKLQKNIKKIV